MHIAVGASLSAPTSTPRVSSNTCELLLAPQRSAALHGFRFATQRPTTRGLAIRAISQHAQESQSTPDYNESASYSSREGASGSTSDPTPSGNFSRRAALLAPLGAGYIIAAASGRPALAIQGLTAGRVPGISGAPDADGFQQYQRPEGKSGGHGVGWSEIPRYKFRVPSGWDDTPVSIADLGGTEIDLRYGNKKEGELSVVVAPVLRFLDIGFNANLKIEDVGPPDKLIAGFAPELFGGPLNEEDVLSTETISKDGRSYYQWALDFKQNARPHHLVTATAVGNRVFLLSVSASARQWRFAEPKLRTIWESFYVPGPRVNCANLKTDSDKWGLPLC